jgi:hypothetical protein
MILAKTGQWPIDEPAAPLAKRTRPHSVGIRLSSASYIRLTRAAAKRGVKPRDLATRIIETVLHSGLIKAVLDDEA